MGITPIIDWIREHYAERQTLTARYAHERKRNLIPVQIAPGKEIALPARNGAISMRSFCRNLALTSIPTEKCRALSCTIGYCWLSP